MFGNWIGTSPCKGIGSDSETGRGGQFTETSGSGRIGEGDGGIPRGKRETLAPGGFPRDWWR